MFYITFILAIITDYLTKNLAANYLKQDILILWDFLKLKFIKNSWIAFSIPITWNLLKIITLILILWISIHYFKYEKIKKSRLNDIAFGLIIWWAIWNAIERIAYWQVIDFISLKYFAIFNFGDIFISIWVIIILVINFYKNEWEK